MKRLIVYIYILSAFLNVFINSCVYASRPANAIGPENNADLLELILPPPPQKVVAITFDDGPHPVYTSLLTDTLKRHNAKATFFIVGKRAEQFPELLKRIAEANCEIANHTYSHPNFIWLSEKEMDEELIKTSEIVKRISGKKLRFFRPPGGNTDMEVKEVVEKNGLKMIMWDINTADYSGISGNAIKRKIFSRVRNGSIILMHDGVIKTVEILSELITELQKQGYVLVTISELLKIKRGPQKPDYDRFDAELCKRFSITKELIEDLRKKGASSQDILKLCELAHVSGEPIEKLVIMYNNGIALRLISKIIGIE